MSQKLTIVYQTARRNPRIQWFLDSLNNQLNGEKDIFIVVVDRLKSVRDLTPLMSPLPLKWVEPKPSVWQGRHRLTKEDWFAASNSRNTGLCHALDGYVAFVDDLSVLHPQWLQAVKDAMAGNYCVAGAYRKVSSLLVEDGKIISYDNFPAGHDNRFGKVSQDVTPCSGDWLYGCSCAMPVEALLKMGGWLEICDGMGFEDVCTGIVLNNAGFGFKYDRRMMTFESEEAHHEEPALRRTDKGQSPLDKSHALLRLARSGQKYFDNYYEEGISGERKQVLAGGDFTIRKIPDRCWFNGQLISEH